MELTQVSLIRELSFIIQYYGTLWADYYVSLLTEKDEWGPNIQISSLDSSLTIKISGLSGCFSTRR